MGLAIPSSVIAAEIQSNPAFQDVAGRFSKQVFDQLLRQVGLSEAGYLALRKREDARELVTEAVGAPTAVPQTLINIVHAYQNERRVIEATTLTTDKLVKLGDPDEAKLRSYYDDNKRVFDKPESRRLAVLLLTRDGVAGKIPLTEEELKAAFEADRARFTVPERRQIYPLPFRSKADAENAAAELKTAADFAAAAEKLGFKPNDYDLGLIAKSGLIDQAVAEAAFSLEKGALSDPIEGRFATVLVKVVDVTAGRSPAFEEVRQQVRERLLESRVRDELTALSDKVEDERSAGRSLKDAADKFQLEYLDLESIERSGLGPEGKQMLEHPDSDRILAAGFGSRAGTEDDAIELSDGGFAWIDVLSVTPQSERPFEAVRDEVARQWREAETARELAVAAGRLVDRLGKGESLEAIAAGLGGKIERSEPIGRQGAPPFLTSNAVQQSFALPKGGASSTAGRDGSSRILFRVVDILPAAEPTKEESDALRNIITRQQQGEVLTAYVSALQQRYGVTMNEAAIRQALGLGATQ